MSPDVVPNCGAWVAGTNKTPVSVYNDSAFEEDVAWAVGCEKDSEDFDARGVDLGLVGVIRWKSEGIPVTFV